MQVTINQSQPETGIDIVVPTTIAVEFRKKYFLTEMDRVVQDRWPVDKYYSDAPACLDSSAKKKYFVTFPFPYMNGRLHLGHVYTMLKADIMARHHTTRGYHTLFPFGYHLTGIPISAAAAKIQDELGDGGGPQHNIMMKMGIDASQVPEFANPIHWTKYFPTITSDTDLPMIGCSIDTRRSFITTSANAHFDSFVQWHISKLHTAGYVKFGKKMVIYSEKDGQPCSHADRTIGENVEIRGLKIAMVRHRDCAYFVTHDKTAPIDHIVRSKNFVTEVIKYPGRHQSVYIVPEFGRNMRGQNKLTGVVESDNPSMVVKEIDCDISDHFSSMPECTMTHGSGLYTSDPSLEWTDYFEPNALVVSRSGDRCTVAETDQWYIMYDDENWRSGVYNFVSEHVWFNDTTARNIMLASIKSSHPWPFSRTFGLGSKIPFDTKYLVDSLSDSTVYMAYYTVAHLVTKIPQQELSNDVWDAIFANQESRIVAQYPELFEKMRREFTFWYPVDLRVSGKDLLTNHLTMMFFNHWAVFGAEYMPRAIFANGHIMVNGEKMSKTKGNFVTLNQAVSQYGTTVTRFVAACAGDTIDDGNFNIDEVNIAVLALSAEIQNWAKSDMNRMRRGPYQFTDHLYKQLLVQLVAKIDIAYQNVRIRDVVNMGFNAIQTLRHKYENPHADIYKLFLQAQLAAMWPIIPHWASYLSVKYAIDTTWPHIKIDASFDNAKTQWLAVYCEIIERQVRNKLKKFKKNIQHISCLIEINHNIGAYLDAIVECNLNDKLAKSALLSKFSDKASVSAILGLADHFKKYGSEYSICDLRQWLMDDNCATVQSYFDVRIPHVKFTVSLTDAHCHPLAPKISIV